MKPKSESREVEAALNAAAMDSLSVLAFFVLVFLLSIPFWLVGAATNLQLLPGLPGSSLMVVCPALAALALAFAKQSYVGMWWLSLTMTFPPPWAYTKPPNLFA